MSLSFEKNSKISAADPLISFNPKIAEEDRLALEVNDLSKGVFGSMEPNVGGKSLENLITPTGESAKTVVEAANPLLVGDSSPRPPRGGFPNLMKEGLIAGLNQMGRLSSDLNKITDDIKEIQRKIEAVLKTSQSLTKLPRDKDSFPITPEMRADFDLLKEMGFDLLGADEKSISAEKLSLIRTDLDGIKSGLNTDVQTKMMHYQTKTGYVNSNTDSMRTMLKAWERLLDSILRRMSEGR